MTTIVRNEASHAKIAYYVNPLSNLLFSFKEPPQSQRSCKVVPHQITPLFPSALCKFLKKNYLMNNKCATIAVVRERRGLEPVNFTDRVRSEYRVDGGIRGRKEGLSLAESSFVFRIRE